jgi:hypothetical protein
MSEAPTLSFNAVRQFVVVPDRYYKVDLVNGLLTFVKTGGQFDADHPGSVGRGKMMNYRPARAPAAEGHYNEAQRAVAVLIGIGIIVVSVVLLLVAARAGWLVMGFAFTAAFGGVVLLAALVTPTDRERARRAHDFSLPLDQIESAVLHIPIRSGAVARLHLQPKGEKPIKLTINTRDDLRIVRNSLLPALGSRAAIRDNRA